MSKDSVAIIGSRGMVGSVLRERMLAEGDFEHVDTTLFSTSQVGQASPDGQIFQNAYDLESLSDFGIVLTTQGSEYTAEVHHKLRDRGWDGYWIDAASELRTSYGAIPVLDPVNRDVIDRKLAAGKEDLIGANCTVSTMLMGLTPLFKQGHVEWVSDMTYQAASGAGAQHMVELLKQMGRLGAATRREINTPAIDILEVDKAVNEELASGQFPIRQWGVPLAANVIPWIDQAMDNGQTREEWKGFAETNNVLGLEGDDRILVDGTCVRVGSMRSHAHGLTIKLKQDIPIYEIEAMLKDSHDWIKVIPNSEEATKAELTSVAASGDLQVHVGRLRKMAMGPEYLGAFVVGDQLLWGAAEPLRRALLIVTNNL